MKGEISDINGALLFIVAGIAFACGGLFTASMVRAKRPNEEKNTSYECGESPVGNAWGNFNIRFYIVALVFILFEVEIVFLFPWATVFGNEALIAEYSGWGWFALIEMFIFIGILVLGLVYVWSKGFLDWVKPTITTKNYKSPVPEKLYEAINQKEYKGSHGAN